MLPISLAALLLSLVLQNDQQQNSHKYYACYKPILMLCSWKDDTERAARKNRAARTTLNDLHLPSEALFNNDIAKLGLHLVGRLDRDSEGLLVLTTDGQFTAQVLSESCHKTYWALVQGQPTPRAYDELRRGGLVIRGATTRPPISVRALNDARRIHQKLPPPALGMDRAGTWIELVLNEGRNRQIRRITAAVGHPTIRLCRVAVGGLKLDSSWVPGECHEIERDQVLAGKLS